MNVVEAKLIFISRTWVCSSIDFLVYLSDIVGGF